MADLTKAIANRRTFAIISHPDAGKTTITEKLLLLGNAIQVAGSVKGKRGPHATSDWMTLEQERGISVTSSVMQFPYRGRTVNLLDTPGHEDFSEDTYRTLTAVDSALMVIDGAKGVEDRTIKLMGVCRLRDTPIFSFVNKMDRDIRDPIELLDEIESVLDIAGAPINWPIGMGRDFKGVYNLYTDVALGNFGVREMLDDFVEWAPAPQGREATPRQVSAAEPTFSGFVFKIQANMDPRHRDRIAFLRVCSGRYQKGMKMRHTRIGKDVRVVDAVTFKAGERVLVEEAFAGDIIGLHNHGTIQIGDTFTEGEELQFSGIPHFAPELFRRIRLRDPMKSKQLQKGLQQLSEEGSTQVFAPLNSSDLIVGAVGQLQFDVVVYRLADEYKVEAGYEPVNVYTARWVHSDDPRKLEEFRKKASDQLSIDGGGHLTYLAPTRVNLSLMEERWPDIDFLATREH